MKLTSTAIDEARRGVQQNTLGRRGHKKDPLYRIRRLLTTTRENLTEATGVVHTRTRPYRPQTNGKVCEDCPRRCTDGGLTPAKV